VIVEVPSFTMTINQVGPDVVMSGTGYLNIEDLTYGSNGSIVGNSQIQPNAGTFITGLSGQSNFEFYTGFTTNPTEFGTGDFLDATSTSGDLFGVTFGNDFELLVPDGYTTGNVISSTMTFTGQTFSSLGVTPGTYPYTWGSGANVYKMNVVVEN
jgi:hypothetical protein